MLDIKLMLELLEKMHPNAKCELNYKNPFELLVAVILSAQCTDKRVNIVTKKLFDSIKNPKDFACVAQDKLEKKIFSCGLQKHKAKNIIEASKDIIEKLDGKVPQNVNDLMKLSGVGKKTANVVFAEAFGGQCIAVDTHVGRVAQRLGLTNSKSPIKIENDLMKLLPQNMWSRSHHLFIFHGRYICHSQNPKCERCLLCNMCEYKNLNLNKINKG